MAVEYLAELKGAYVKLAGTYGKQQRFIGELGATAQTANRWKKTGPASWALDRLYEMAKEQGDRGLVEEFEGAIRRRYAPFFPEPKADWSREEGRFAHLCAQLMRENAEHPLREPLLSVLKNYERELRKRDRKPR